MTDGPGGLRRRQLGLLLLSCATLLLQISWTRVLSVALWYHFAFLVVSTAMLGVGFSGVLLTVSRRLGGIDLDRGLTLFAAGQLVSTIGGFALANALPFAPFSLMSDPAQLAYTPLFLLCIAAPFTFMGLAAALLLSRLPLQAGSTYFFDLIGAAIGCVAIIAVMPALGGSGSIIASSALAALAFACFATRKTVRVAGLAVALVVGLLSLHAERLLPLRISRTKRFAGRPVGELLASQRDLYTAWNTSSRVDVIEQRGQRAILIDAGTAVTRAPRVRRPARALGPLQDERAIALGPGQRVLVIGAGGGFDVLAALRAGARRVVAVEVNPLITGLVTDGPLADYVGRIFDDPRVELHTDEARSFLRRSDERFDVIVASHTISNAATAAGALALAESYLLTVEAFDDYLRHLRPDGLLWITRPESQLPRLFATARAGLARHGIHSAKHRLLSFAGAGHPSFYGGLVVSRAALAHDRVVSAARRLHAAHLRALYLPGRARGPQIYRRIATASPEQLEQIYGEAAHRLRPVTDDRPFFNQRSRWSQLGWTTIARVFDRGRGGRQALENDPVAESVLLVVLVQSAALAFVLLLAPLWWRSRAGLRGSGRLLGHCALIGLGYILAELAFIQRMSLFIGRPAHTFAAVVGAMLLFSGVGSLLSGRLLAQLASHRRLIVLLAGCAVLLGLFDPAFAPLLHAALGLPLAARVALAAALIAPVALLMGTALPLALGHAAADRAAAIPWAWGLNAVASVSGSVLALIVATIGGFSAVFLIAAACYLAASLLWVGGGRR